MNSSSCESLLNDTIKIGQIMGIIRSVHVHFIINIVLCFQLIMDIFKTKCEQNKQGKTEQ